MAEQKTKPSEANVDQFLNAIDNETRRLDSKKIAALMQKATKKKPKLWSGGMVGFGDRHYKYPSGHEGDTFIVGFAPRKSNISLYLTCDLDEHAASLAKLGKYKRGVGCLYVNKLSDADVAVLERMIKASVDAV